MDRNTNFNPFCEEPAFGKRQWLVDFQHAIRLPQHSLESSPSLLPAQRQGPNHPVCFAACVRNRSPPHLSPKGRARAQAGEGLVSRSVAGKVAEAAGSPAGSGKATGKTNDTVQTRGRGMLPRRFQQGPRQIWPCSQAVPASPRAKGRLPHQGRHLPQTGLPPEQRLALPSATRQAGPAAGRAPRPLPSCRLAAGSGSAGTADTSSAPSRLSTSLEKRPDGDC